MEALRRYISGPALARLKACHRVSAREAILSGKYGHVFRIGRHLFVSLAEVERVEGRKFSEHEIELAAAGLDRIITKEETANGEENRRP